MKGSKEKNFQSLGNLWDCLTQFNGVLSKHNESLIKSANSKEQLKILFNIGNNLNENISSLLGLFVVCLFV